MYNQGHNLPSACAVASSPAHMCVSVSTYPSLQAPGSQMEAVGLPGFNRHLPQPRGHAVFKGEDYRWRVLVGVSGTLKHVPRYKLHMYSKYDTNGAGDVRTYIDTSYPRPSHYRPHNHRTHTQ